jgi:hypothetical protein
MQLDLFEHSRDVMLRNQAIEAARDYGANALSDAIAMLATECAGDPLLPALEKLLQRLRVAVTPGLVRAPALEILRSTEESVAAARRVFGNSADAWLAPLWAELAASIANLAFDPGCETLHSAPLLLRARRWSEASASVGTIASWRRQPVPLAWKVEADFRIFGLSAAWPLLSELSWMAPLRAAPLAAALQNPGLDELLRRFEAEFEGDGEPGDFAWFPAWALIAQPQWAAATGLAQPGANTPAERCARQLLNLLALERRGLHAKLIEGRRKLRDINASLFELYMRSR